MENTLSFRASLTGHHSKEYHLRGITGEVTEGILLKGHHKCNYRFMTEDGASGG
jgi:hypothetical protein